MVSLQEMLSNEGFDETLLPSKNKVKSRDICLPVIDEVAIRALISILSEYVGIYLKKKELRAKCIGIIMEKVKKDFDHNGGLVSDLEMVIKYIEERLVDNSKGTTKKEKRLKLLQCSISLLTIVAKLNSKSLRISGSSCRIPNSYLSACAQLYLAIVYKLEKNGRVSAMHLLQVFCDAPFMARIHLVPQIWDHLFLPQLLHLKIWQAEGIEFLRRNSTCMDKEMKINALNDVYNAQMDIGTVKFALYYKEWLKVGVESPVIPVVLPPCHGYSIIPPDPL